MLNTKFWSDSWIRQKLNPLDRYLFIYFLTNEHANICGIYELPIETIAFETGLDERDLEKSLLPRLRPKIYYKNNWVIIPNFPKHQNYQSPTVLEGIKRELSLIPKEISQLAIGYGYGMGIISHLTKPNLTKPNLTKPNLTKPYKTNGDLKKSPARIKRKDFKIPIETYKEIIDAYQQLRGIVLKGAEFGGVKQAIKTMIYSGRTKDDIISFMNFAAKVCQQIIDGDAETEKKLGWFENWTILTIKRKMPEFLSGNFKIDKDFEMPSSDKAPWLYKNE